MPGDFQQEIKAAVRRVLLALAIPASVAMVVIGLVLAFIPLSAPDLIAPEKCGNGSESAAQIVFHPGRMFYAQYYTVAVSDGATVSGPPPDLRDIPARLDTGLKRICTSSAEHRLRNALTLIIAGVALGTLRWRLPHRPRRDWLPGLPA